MVKKNSVKYLAFLMIFSLLGVVVTQYYLLEEAFKTNEKIFSRNVMNAIYQTTRQLREKERDYYDGLLENILKTLKKSPKNSINMGINKIHSHAKAQYACLHHYVVEYIHVPIKMLNKKIKKKLEVENLEFSPLNRDLFSNLPKDYLITNIKKTFDKETYSKIIANHVPIEKRIDPNYIKSLLDRELKEEGIHTSYEFVVLNSDLLGSKVKSENYNPNFDIFEFKEDLFLDRSGKPSYFLSIYFPGKNKTVVGMIFHIIIFSIGVVLIILGVCTASLFYLGKQKRISQMKSDFINNITHELKTPIATINIATKILRNPLANQDPEKVNYYSEIIEKENKRLNSQVDMVLTIAKLENNSFNLTFEPVKLDVIVAQAVDRIRLIVSDRKGIINEKYGAEGAYIYANPIHFENVILNILENAEKYSYKDPFISVSTFVKENFAFIQVEDKGIGMSKEVLKKVFDPFFRAEGGNIHNVKGYGLGLSYCQKIIDLHKGAIFIESNKKGTKCIIKMNLK